MHIDDVPQEGNATLSGVRKAVYAKDESGQIISVASAGWEAEEIVTQHAVDALKTLADQALVRAKAGQSSSLEFWMYEKRMDVVVLSQSTGIWQWRVRRHLQANRFTKLPAKLINTYADALGITADHLKSLP